MLGKILLNVTQVEACASRGRQNAPVSDSPDRLPGNGLESSGPDIPATVTAFGKQLLQKQRCYRASAGIP
jgi:hypothetical protein